MSAPVSENIRFSIVSQFSTKIVNLVCFPLIVSFMGETRYGLWILLFSLLGYLPLLELGIGGGIVKYGSENRNELGVLTGSTIQVLMLVCLPAVFVLWWLVPMVPSLLSIPGEFHAETVFALRAGLVLFFVQITLSPIDNALLALERFRESFFFSGVPEIMKTLLLLLGAGAGWSFGMIILLFLTVSLVARAFAFRTLLRLHPGFLSRFFSNPFRPRMLLLIRYGLTNVFVSLSTIVTDYTDKILLQVIIADLRALTYYEIARKVLQIFYGLVKSFVNPLTPAFSRWQGEKKQEVIQRTIRIGYRYLGIFVIPLITMLFVNSALPLSVWFYGQWTVVANASSVVSAISIGILAYILLLPITTYLFSAAQHGIIARWCGVIVLVNLGLDFLLIPRLGPLGAAIALAAGFFAGNAGIFVESRRKIPALRIPLTGFGSTVSLNILFFIACVFLKRFHPFSITGFTGLYLLNLLSHFFISKTLKPDDLRLLGKILGIRPRS